MMGSTPLQGEAGKPPVQVAAEDAELIKKIRRVLKNGNNVEIRQDKNGNTKVFRVLREIQK